MADHGNLSRIFFIGQIELIPFSTILNSIFRKNNCFGLTLGTQFAFDVMAVVEKMKTEYANEKLFGFNNFLVNLNSAAYSP